jgi:raffinose/stachyose/melibiose transport system permease protein
MRKRRFDARCYALVAPAVLSLALWYYVPVLQSFGLSLFDWDGVTSGKYVGLSNYTEILSDPVFWRSLGNMAIVLAFSLTVPFFAPFVAAELVGGLASRRLRAFFRSAMVLPVVVPSVVWILMWRSIYDPTNGALNRFFRAVGAGELARNWLSDPATALGALLFIGFPFVSNTALLIFSAALDDIPQDIYDAARIEGIPLLRRIASIDLPFCVPQLRLLAVTSFAGIIANYTSVLLLTQGRPLNRTMLPGYYLYRASASEQRFGLASAVGLVLIILILILTLASQRFLRSSLEYEARS